MEQKNALGFFEFTQFNKYQYLLSKFGSRSTGYPSTCCKYCPTVYCSYYSSYSRTRDKKLKFNEGSNCVAPLTPTSIRFITLQSPLSHPLGVGVTCISNTPVPCCFCFARLDLRRVLTSYSTVSFSS